MGLMVGDDLLCAEFISIHLPVGVGQIRKEIPLRRAIFQSTHPVRGGTASTPAETAENSV